MDLSKRICHGGRPGTGREMVGQSMTEQIQDGPCIYIVAVGGTYENRRENEFFWYNFSLETHSIVSLSRRPILQGLNCLSGPQPTSDHTTTISIIASPCIFK
jgi:hypothetical protein